MRPAFRTVVFLLVNMYAVYLAVGGIAFLVSSLSDRRGTAVGTVFAIVLISFLVNFLAPSWPPAKQAAVASFMHYYQPAQILRSGGFPWQNFSILFGGALVTWFAGGLIFSRRDVCTV
jgi:hypothetical protein